MQYFEYTLSNISNSLLFSLMLFLLFVKSLYFMFDSIQ